MLNGEVGVGRLSDISAEMQLNCEFRVEYKIGMYFGLLKVQILVPDWPTF
jgi:hypothetical protein